MRSTSGGRQQPQAEFDVRGREKEEVARYWKVEPNEEEARELESRVWRNVGNNFTVGDLLQLKEEEMIVMWDMTAGTLNRLVE